MRNLTGNNIPVFECKNLYSTFSFILLIDERPELPAPSAETTPLLNSDYQQEICVLPVLCPSEAPRNIAEVSVAFFH